MKGSLIYGTIKKGNNADHNPAQCLIIESTPPSVYLIYPDFKHSSVKHPLTRGRNVVVNQWQTTQPFLFVLSSWLKEFGLKKKVVRVGVYTLAQTHRLVSMLAGQRPLAVNQCSQITSQTLTGRDTAMAMQTDGGTTMAMQTLYVTADCASL